MPDPSRILLIRPSALGDVCRTVPALASLRQAFPNARIDWLVQDSFAAAIQLHPALTTAIPFPRRALGQAARRLGVAPIRAFLRTLRQPRYDLVFDLQGLARSGLFAWCTRALRRVGFANARELGWLGINERHQVPASTHTVDRMLELIRRAGIAPVHDLRLYTSPQDQAMVRADPQLSGRSYAILAPTSRWPAKRWPADRFAEVARHLVSRGVTVVLVGSKSERDQCGPILDLAASDPRVIDRIGHTTVGELMAFIESSSLVIANDSAALHMAVGFDRPLIGLYGPTRIDLVGPYRREADVLQHIGPDDRLDHKNDASIALMQRISTDEVIAALHDRLSTPTR